MSKYFHSIFIASKLRHDEILSIQYLRGIAALLVVFHHSLNPQPWLFNPIEWFNGGAKGIDIFFVISGFVMTITSTNKRPYVFIRGRIIRIVPLYWLMTMVYVGLSLAVKPDNLEGGHIISSLLFIPEYSPRHPGLIWPVLVPGWTLNFEMFFYAIFAFGLLLRRPFLTCLIIITMLVLLGFSYNSVNPFFLVYTSPSLLEFLTGMVIGKIYQQRNDFPTVLWPLGLICFFWLLFHENIVGTEYALVLNIFCSVAVVIGGLSIEPILRRKPSLVLYQLGNASYSIYLGHILFLGFWTIVFKYVPLHGPTQFIAFLSTAVIGSAIAGIIIHLWLEKPLTSLISKMRMKPNKTRV